MNILLPSSEKATPFEKWFGPAGKLVDNCFRIGGRFQIALCVGEAKNLVRIADVEVFRIGAGRIERETEGKIEFRREHLHLSHFAVGTGMESQHHALILRGDKEVAIGGGDDGARRDGFAVIAFQALGVKLDFESGGCLRPCVTARDGAREDGRGFRRVGVGQISSGDVVHVARRFALEIRKHARSAGLGVRVNSMARWWGKAWRRAALRGSARPGCRAVLRGSILTSGDDENQRHKTQRDHRALIKTFHSHSSSEPLLSRQLHDYFTGKSVGAAGRIVHGRIRPRSNHADRFSRDQRVRGIRNHGITGRQAGNNFDFCSQVVTQSNRLQRGSITILNGTDLQVVATKNERADRQNQGRRTRGDTQMNLGVCAGKKFALRVVHIYFDQQRA